MAVSVTKAIAGDSTGGAAAILSPVEGAPRRSVANHPPKKRAVMALSIKVAIRARLRTQGFFFSHNRKNGAAGLAGRAESNKGGNDRCTDANAGQN
jgi:hypothetical protein